MKAVFNWPHGKRFAFTVFDDTDLTTLGNAPRIYELLFQLGMLTTKSVWPIKGERVPSIGGTTCADSDYLEWVCRLKELGFEIALHNVTYHTSKREQAIAGLEQFKNYFGQYPKIQVNHADCRDSMYWGDARLTGVNRLVYNILTRFRNHGISLGGVESSDCFWGDKCKQHIRYVRNFVYPEINTIKACPIMPYFDAKRPYVNNWFASSEGSDCRAFCRTISGANQERLEEEGGACIMYTHFGRGDFYGGGQINLNFRKLMERMSRRNGWFVPVSTILDYIEGERGRHVISGKERNRLERKWLIHKITVTRGTS